jgi:isopropylmalate/homocitrate/citramalate synthase
MSDHERRLFVQFEAGRWTDEQVDSLTEALHEATPDDVSIVATPDDIEYLTEEQVENYVKELTEALGE